LVQKFVRPMGGKIRPGLIAQGVSF